MFEQQLSCYDFHQKKSFYSSLLFGVMLHNANTHKLRLRKTIKMLHFKHKYKLQLFLKYSCVGADIPVFVASGAGANFALNTSLLNIWKRRYSVEPTAVCSYILTAILSPLEKKNTD